VLCRGKAAALRGLAHALFQVGRKFKRHRHSSPLFYRLTASVRKLILPRLRRITPFTLSPCHIVTVSSPWLGYPRQRVISVVQDRAASAGITRAAGEASPGPSPRRSL